MGMVEDEVKVRQEGSLARLAVLRFAIGGHHSHHARLPTACGCQTFQATRGIVELSNVGVVHPVRTSLRLSAEELHLPTLDGTVHLGQLAHWRPLDSGVVGDFGPDQRLDRLSGRAVHLDEHRADWRRVTTPSLCRGRSRAQLVIEPAACLFSPLLGVAQHGGTAGLDPVVLFEAPDGGGSTLVDEKICREAVEQYGGLGVRADTERLMDGSLRLVADVTPIGDAIRLMLAFACSGPSASADGPCASIGRSTMARLRAHGP